MHDQTATKNEGTHVERINPYLNVRDIKASLDYYVDLLGFHLFVETPNIAILEWDGHQIHLISPDGEITSHRVWIGVGDICVLYKQFSENGARIYQEPTNFSWAYQMIIEDLDGNLLIFGSGPKQELPFQD